MRSPFAAIVAAVVLATAVQSGAQADDATSAPAFDAIAAAIEEHPVVLIGEIHQWSAEHRFLRRLIASDALDGVDDIAVEFGNVRYQKVIDAYIRGAKVEPVKLRRAWQDTTQGSVWATADYAAFFAAVRRRNLSSGPDARVRVLLSDPPINTRKRLTPQTYDHWILQRDNHFATVIHRNALQRGRRVLVVAGVGHVLRQPAPRPTLTNLLEGRVRCETDPLSIAAGIDWCDDLRPYDPTTTYVIVPSQTQSAASAVVVDLARSELGTNAAGEELGIAGADQQTLRDVADGYLLLAAS